MSLARILAAEFGINRGIADLNLYLFASVLFVHLLKQMSELRFVFLDGHNLTIYMRIMSRDLFECQALY